MANNATQRAEAPRPNNTGMPDNLKSGIESLSGFSMDDVRVHYNSSKPATVQAFAYTQGTDIHVAPGQEKHLPHEAWHVAQQMAGRVSPTTNINGMPVNDNASLEHEADVMGEKAFKQKNAQNTFILKKFSIKNNNIQKMPLIPTESESPLKDYEVKENHPSTRLADRALIRRKEPLRIKKEIYDSNKLNATYEIATEAGNLGEKTKDEFLGEESLLTQIPVEYNTQKKQVRLQMTYEFKRRGAKGGYMGGPGYVIKVEKEESALPSAPNASLKDTHMVTGDEDHNFSGSYALFYKDDYTHFENFSRKNGTEALPLLLSPSVIQYPSAHESDSRFMIRTLASKTLFSQMDESDENSDMQVFDDGMASLLDGEEKELYNDMKQKIQRAQIEQAAAEEAKAAAEKAKAAAEKANNPNKRMRGATRKTSKTDDSAKKAKYAAIKANHDFNRKTKTAKTFFEIALKAVLSFEKKLEEGGKLSDYRKIRSKQEKKEASKDDTFRNKQKPNFADAYAKLAGEGARFCCIRNNMDRITNNTVFFFSNKFGRRLGITTQKLWSTWSTLFSKEYNISDKDIVKTFFDGQHDEILVDLWDPNDCIKLDQDKT